MGACESMNGHGIPARAGIGLRPPHYRQLLDELPDIGWLEVHSENYFCEGGQPLYFLDRLRRHYPVSLHGVGLSLGSTDALSREHLTNLARLIDRVEPALVSEHLSWSSVGGRFYNDLLPLPHSEQALAVVCRHINQAQEFLGRQILVENVSSYLQFAESNLPEWEFVAEVARRTGCGILLDVNNVYVSSVNHGFDAARYLRGIPTAHVREIHLAGHDHNGRCLIDTHGARVAEPVWALYREAVARFGRVPTLIEWDTDLPPLAVLVDEAAAADRILADTIMENRHALAA
ncbi:MAG: DUF692 domain-containing protein [Betaproteobacteria bacterium]|nr:DUF692 domain-containing protein [Betaproteobacteria bacterium]